MAWHSAGHPHRAHVRAPGTNVTVEDETVGFERSLVPFGKEEEESGRFAGCLDEFGSKVSHLLLVRAPRVERGKPGARHGVRTRDVRTRVWSTDVILREEVRQRRGTRARANRDARVPIRDGRKRETRRDDPTNRTRTVTGTRNQDPPLSCDKSCTDPSRRPRNPRIP